MTEAEQLAARISEAIPNVKRGTLRFWGQWFGRPYDNVHTLVRCDAEENILRLYFNEGEVLSVWSPRNLQLDDSTFRISSAERVRWEWFYYGRPKLPSNCYFLDFMRSGKEIAATSNVDRDTPDRQLKASHPAVEIL